MEQGQCLADRRQRKELEACLAEPTGGPSGAKASPLGAQRTGKGVNPLPAVLAGNVAA